MEKETETKIQNNLSKIFAVGELLKNVELEAEISTLTLSTLGGELMEVYTNLQKIFNDEV